MPRLGSIPFADLKTAVLGHFCASPPGLRKIGALQDADWSNSLLSRRPTVFKVHELIHRHVRQKAIAQARKFAPEGVIHVKQENGKFRKIGG